MQTHFVNSNYKSFLLIYIYIYIFREGIYDKTEFSLKIMYLNFCSPYNVFRMITSLFVYQTNENYFNNICSKV
jgi:hypothetical protein